jgi:molybdenum cofactor cytidylyltransferase
MNIATLILAAGSSSRMGTSKQLLPIGKTTLLGVIIENALLSKANNIHCILGANHKIISTSISKYNVDIILNPKYKSGLSSSIVAGLQHIKDQNFDAVLILLGDQPLITSTSINLMIETYQKHNKNIIASLYNTAPGVPAVIPKKYFNSLLKLEGDKGAKGFLQVQKENLITLNNSNLMDIDTKHEYEDYVNSKNFE